VYHIFIYHLVSLFPIYYLLARFTRSQALARFLLRKKLARDPIQSQSQSQKRLA